MVVGGCFCGKVRVEYTQPIVSALCHCLDCRKLTGSPYSYNILVQTAKLQVSGNPKEVPKTADSGSDIKNYFCPDCGTPLFGRKVNAAGEPDETTVVRAGILDDAGQLNEQKPQVEIYTASRLEWISPIEGARQFKGMMSK